VLFAMLSADISKVWCTDLPFLNTLNLIKQNSNGYIANIGCGTCDYDIEICERFKDIIIDAYDDSEEMIKIAQERVNSSKFKNRINLKKQNIRNIKKKYDMIFSTNTLHHFYDPADFWISIKNMSNDKTKILIIDILRPESDNIINDIVTNSAQTLDNNFIKSYKNSLRSAFTIEEIKTQLVDNNLHNLRFKNHLLPINPNKLGNNSLNLVFIYGKVNNE
jgi:cyclopropane fatty-acyl-phospholipid synthase-like methyltransferase